MIGYCARYKNLPLFLTYCLTKVEIGGNVEVTKKNPLAYCSYKSLADIWPWSPPLINVLMLY